jgi:hypothetical protein
MAKMSYSGTILYYVGAVTSEVHKKRRTDGCFYIVPDNFMCDACSGSTGGLACIPEGRYLASNFRDRTVAAMTRDGVGFSVDLSDIWDPYLGRQRTLLRIHPDGAAPGTAGCVGILSDVAACRDLLRETFPAGAVQHLEVLIVDNPRDVPWSIEGLQNLIRQRKAGVCSP